MNNKKNYRLQPTVALRKESVDRNQKLHQVRRMQNVALRKESVDRNGPAGSYPPE